MIRHLQRLSADTLVYAGGSLAVKGAALLLIPLYTRRLGPAEYGLLALLATLDAALTVLLGLGLAAAVVKVYHDDAAPREQRRVISTAAWFLVGFTLVAGAALWAGGRPLSRLALGSSEETVLVRLTIAAACLDILRSIALTALRVQGQAIRYAVLSLAHFLLLVALNVVLVALLGRGLRGVVESNLYAAAALWLYSAVFLLRRFGLGFSGRALRSLLRFGLPLVPGGLASWAMILADREFLRVYGSRAEVGLYALAYTFGMVVNMLVVQPFRTAWLPFAFSIQRDQSARRVYALTLTGVVLVGLFLVLAIALPAREWLLLVGTAEYAGGYRVIPLVALAYLGYGVCCVVDIGVLLTGKTLLYALVLGAGAALNLGLNLALIPRWGMMGAAGATLLSYLGLAAAMTLASQRLYPIHYEWARLGRLALVAAALYALGSRIHTGILLADLALKLAWAGTMPLWLFVVMFFRPAELEALARAARRLFERFGAGMPRRPPSEAP